ncbi:MAG: TetR family transcriptional regulator [Pseudonocardiales bacterium]|nr:TetR family transcriptional regulator [Jatrophihabitantaceae bacterium]MCW2601949.1 TetR family transcriptional regulator [Pseudonocardiales bacterium]
MTTTSVTSPAPIASDPGNVPAEASRPLRKDAARNRELLIASAREVFAQRGMEATLDDIARHAGLGVGTAYRHFANKHELARALMEQTIDGIVAALDAAGANPDPLAGLIGFLESAMAVQAADRGLRQVMMGMHDAAQMEQVHDRMGPVLEDLVGRAQAAGQVRLEVGPTDIGMMVTMLCTVADIVADAAPELWRRYLAIYLNGICTQTCSTDVMAAFPPLSEAQFRTAMAAYKGSLG